MKRLKGVLALAEKKTHLRICLLNIFLFKNIHKIVFHLENTVRRKNRQTWWVYWYHMDMLDAATLLNNVTK